MIFDKNRPVKIVMLGAGGTGGHVAPHLYRLLHTLDRKVEFIIADGDVVERKNLVRQNFIAADLGENKAKVLASRYASVFGMETQYIPSFIEDQEALKKLLVPRYWRPTMRLISSAEFISGSWDKKKNVVTELVILIGAVDNNRSRRLCHSVFSEMPELAYIDSGNGEYTGQVVCGVRKSGRTYYKPVGTLYPDILEPTDKFPTELSCAEASISATQSIVANIMAATVIVNFVYNIVVRGELDVENTTFSTTSVAVRSTTKQNKRRKVA